MTRALRQLPFPWRSQFSPRTHSGAALETLLRSERRREEKRAREGEELEEKNEGAAQPCVTNNHRSAAAALSTRALTVTAWRLLLKWEAFERHLYFVLWLPCSNDGEQLGGLVLVYHDGCSKASCHNGVPAWIAALLQWYVQMPGYWAPRFSNNTAEDHNPDGFDSLVEGTAAQCVLRPNLHICRASNVCLIRHSMWFTCSNSIQSRHAPVVSRPDTTH